MILMHKTNNKLQNINISEYGLNLQIGFSDENNFNVQIEGNFKIAGKKGMKL